MKGISHFTIGIAAASCFPGAVRAATEGDPLYFILAGVFGLLPDTIDFKFVRFFYKTEINVVPDPLRPNAQSIASGVALAVARAHVENRAVNIKLNTIPLGADRWQRYQVRFDVPGRRVHATYGPVVDTGGNPIPDDPATPASAGLTASAALPCAVALEYLATTDIDIFDGPVFRMDPTEGGRVRPEFIPWHRGQSHSLVTALVLGLAGAAVWDVLAGAVIASAFAAHILADQLGYLGSNLFAPFTRRRAPGLKLAHAVWPMPNFTACWLSILLIFWNLARETTGGIEGLNPLRYAIIGAGLPILVFALLQRAAETEDARRATPAAFR